MRIIKEEKNHENNMTPKELEDNEYPSYTIVMDFPKDLYSLVLEFADTYGVFMIPDVSVGIALCSPHEQYNKKKGRELAISRMMPVDMQIYDISIDRSCIEARCFVTFDFYKDYTLEFKLIRYKRHKKLRIEMSSGFRSIERTLKHVLTSEGFKKMIMANQMEQAMMGMEPDDNLLHS